MGKKKIVSILLSLISTFLFAEIQVNSSTASALDVSLRIPELQIVEAKSTDGNMYSKLIVPQAGQLEVGKPDVPGFARWILIPNGTSVDISTYPGEPVVYENVELAPVQPSPIDRLDAPLPPFTKDELVFSTNSDYPGVFAQAEPTKNKRGQSLTILWIYPYQYNPVRKTLTVYPDLEVSVSFSGMIQPIPFNLKNDNLETYLRSIAINADEVLQAEENAESYLPEDNTRTDGCELLIITDPNNLDAANTLANWRIRRGVYTTVVTTTTTGTTTNQIENYIDNAYDNWTPAPSYLLFIGDAEDIPVWYSGSTATDFFYADYDDPPDYQADFGYGRLSVDTASQADSLVARIIRYEKSPSTNSSYYTDILNAACFQDGELPSEMPDQIANRRFCKTSEDVRNYLHDIQSYPWSQREYVAYNRVGSAEIFPRWWNDTNQTFTYIFENDNPPNGGVEIPASMQKPTFPWDGNTADISSAFNNGVFFALFRAHGSISGWGDPDFYSWNVDALNNGEDRPIVWSITCQSGHFDNNECFAEHWIRHSTGGSCGVLAATRDSYSGKNDRLIWGMMNAIWPTFDSYCLFSYGGSTPIYRMGDVKNYGMDYMSTHYSVGNREETIRLFHWFGDPTMEMWTSQPSQLTSAQVTSNIDIGTSSITVQINPAMSGFLVSICSENADEIFGTATTNASGIATVPLNNAITIPGELYVTITKHNYKPYEFVTGWGTWTGAINYYWHNANNWSLGHIPLSTENAIITTDGYHPPKVDIYDELCRSVTINPGASLDIKDQKLTVGNDMTIYGELIMSDTAAELYIGDDIVWESGSSASITGSNAKISVQGDWNFESGANVQLNMGFVDFHGTGNTWIRNYDEDCNFNHIRNWKSGSYSMNISELSTADLYINGNIYNYSDSKIKLRSNHSVYLDGFFNNMNGYFEGQYGTFVYSGNPSVVSLKPTTGSYFNNLIIDSGTSALSLGADYSSTLTINGDFTLESGYLYPGSFTVEIGGNWTNNAGIDHFGEASSRVIFNGTEHQYVNSDETFNILEVDCGAALRVDNVNHTVTCNSYDWTSGGIDILSGTFTALDLADNGIYGGYWVNPYGTINLHQNSGQWIDLNGSIWMSGGTMNIYGGSGESYWPWLHDASITMSGGVLDIKEQSIRIHNSGSYTLTENLTGGTIRTPLNFTVARTDFNPAGGTIELYGSVDAVVSMVSESNLHDLKINKVAPSEGGDSISKAQDFVIVKERDGTETRIDRSNTITAQSELDINGNFIIEAGVFNSNDYTMYVGGSWVNNVGDAGFIEGNGRVVFNSASHQFCYGEAFNILELNKPMMDFIIPYGTTTTCQQLDWTDYNGELEVNGGTFIAYDLEENGIYGNYLINYGGGLLELHQDALSLIDLNGLIHIRAGTMEVHGGSGTSWWSFGGDADITMYDGVLDFIDNGIYIYNSGNSLTVDISDGTIRTSKSFTGNRTDFNPTGGTIELYGSTDATVSMGTGSNFNNLKINKFSPSDDRIIATKARQYDIVRERDGTETRIERSNTITAADELDINGDFLIEAGVFNPDNNTMYVAGDWANNVGDAAFVEGTGLVVFDGASTADILTDETFYVLELDKTTAAFDALETGSGNGVDVTILQDLILTDGSFELNDPTHLSIGNSVFIHNGAILNANDSGTIHISVVEDWFDLNTSGGFDAGINSVVTFNGTTPGTLHAVRENDYFNDIVINSNSSYLRPSSPGGTTIYCKNMDIQTGKLKLSGYKVIVDITLNISDRLEMTNVNDSLLVGNIIWQAGSNDLITEGAILVNGNWTFADGTTATLGANNTVYFDGSTNQFIYCMDADAEFNDVVIDKSGGAAWIHSTTTDTMRVVGDMTVTSGSIFHVQYADLLIDGTLDVVNTGTMYLAHNGGTLTNNSDFTLNGELNIDGGHALIHGQFELAASGILTIDEGSFVSDAPYTTERAIQSLYGTMNMTNGLFEITNNHISVKNSFVDNISGGRIRCGGSFTANSANTFQPTGGVVELTSNSTGYYLQCTNGNHLYDLEINALQSVLLHDDTTIYNDLEISAGSLISNNKNLHVGGNWTNVVGDAGFVESAGEVIFYGSNESDVTTDEKFFNLTLDKTNPQFHALEIMDGLLIDVLNDLTILDGTLEMNTGSTLNIGNDLTIALDAGLNAYGDSGLTISIGGNWTNDNTIYSSFVGFNPGTSTVYFDGSNDQYLNTASPAEEFYKLVIDKSAGEFKPVNGTEIFGDLDILGGAWYDDTWGLTHNLYGDVYVAATGNWYGAGSIVAFKGDADQTFEFLPNSYLSDIIVDKSPVIRRTNAASEEGQSEDDFKDESRGQTVILNSNLLTQGGSGAMLIEEGTLNLNGHAAGNYGDIIINDGGKILVDEDAELKVGDGESLFVNSGGILEVLGSPGHEAIVTRFSIYDHYNFNVESGGTISADYCIFEYMTANGVNIQDNGIIDASHSFDNCTFRNGSSPGVLLTINNDQSMTINNAIFPENTWGSSFNVQKTLDHGHVEFVDAAGDFAGDDFDNDPLNRIDWTTSGQPDLIITNAVWSNINPLVCNEITVDVTVKNMGNADVADNFYVDLYYNLSTPPVTFQLGDQYQQITTGLPAGDSLIVQFTMICTETQGIWHSYLQVDSDSQIAESDETNNVWGPDTITWQALPVVDDLVIVYNSGTGDIELSWTYAAEADDFNVYRDTDPNFIPAPGNKIGTTFSPNYSEPVSEDKFFYKVTAEKSCPPAENISGKRESRGHMNKINN